MKKVIEKNGNSSKAKKGTVEEWTSIDGLKLKNQKSGRRVQGVVVLNKFSLP